jgi:hypothetical protein
VLDNRINLQPVGTKKEAREASTSRAILNFENFKES